MPPRGMTSYRRRWGNDFSFEPLDVYIDKERERATGLVEQASQEKYGSPFPPLPKPMDVVRRAAQQAAAPKLNGGGGGGSWSDSSPAPKKEGFWKRNAGRAGSGAMKVIKPALTALDAAAETGADIHNPLETGKLMTDPVSIAQTQTMPLLKGQAPPAWGVLKNAMKGPKGFVEAQAEDFHKRPMVDQIVLGTIYDPTNVIGVGIGKSAAVQGAEVAARGGRAARISGALLRAAGKADTVAEAVQGGVMRREVLGAGIGAFASDRAGGDAKQNLTAAALGAAGANLTRKNSFMRQVARELPRQLSPASMVLADGPNADAYFDVLARNGIEPTVDARGRINASEHALLNAMDNPNRVTDVPLLEEVYSLGDPVNPKDSLNTPWNDEPLDLSGISKGRSKQAKDGRESAIKWAEEHRGATPAELRDALDAEFNAVREELGTGTVVRTNGSTAVAEWDASLGNYRFRERTGTDRGKPARNKRKPGVDIENIKAAKRKLGAERMARLDALGEIRDQIDVLAERHTAPKSLEGAPKPPEEATVKQARLDGGAHDTFQTEAELNGYRAGQGSMFAEGEVATKPKPPSAGPKDQANFLDQATPANASGEAGQTAGAAPKSTGNARRRKVAAKGTAADAGTLNIEPVPEAASGDTGIPRRPGETPDPAANGVPGNDAGTPPGADQNANARAGADQAPPREEPKGNERRRQHSQEEPKGPPPPLDRSSVESMLGLEPGRRYTEQELKTAYRQQARRYHPDVNSSETALEDMTTINQAFDWLMGKSGSRRPETGAGAGRSREAGANAGERQARDEARQRARDYREEWQRAWDDAKRRKEEWRRNRTSGFENGRPTGGVGGNPEQGAGMPPGGEPPPPRDREPGMGNPQRGFGQDHEQPTDWLDGRSWERVVNDGTAKQGAKKERVIDKIRRKVRDVRVAGIRLEKERTDQVAAELVDDQVDTLRRQAEKAGISPIQNEAGDWVLPGFSEEVQMEDVVEQSTEAGRRVYAELSDEQKAVVDEIRRINDGWNKTIEAHGGEVPMRDTIEGEYFPRRVVGRETAGGEVLKNKGTGTGRRLGGSRIGTRTQESMAEGIDAGLRYQNPWDALKGGMKTKARIAQDHYLASMVSKLASPSGQAGFGYRTLKDTHPLLTNGRAVGNAFDGTVIKNNEQMIFENAVADELDDLFSAPSVLNTKPGKVVSAINSATTPLRASFDVSFALNQGLAFLESSPGNAAKGGRAAIQIIRSAMGDPQAYAALRTAERDRASELLRSVGIDTPGNEWMRRRNFHYAGEGEIGEFQFPEWMQHIPGLGKGLQWSNETFARYLNYARDVLANDELERAIASGKRGDDLVAHMDEAATSINRMTGWTRTDPSGMESLLLFAPRFFRSNVEQVVAAFTKGGIEGRVARAHLFKLFGFGAVVTYGVNAARGYETDIDPRSPNAFRIRNVFGQDVSLFGPFATLVKGVAQTVGGEPGEMAHDPRGRGLNWGTNIPRPDVSAPVDFARAKGSPVVGTAWSLMTGKTFDGRPIEQDPTKGEFWTNTVKDVASENVPFSVQALFRTGPLGGLTSATGLQSSEVTPAEKRDIAREAVTKKLRLGKDYRSLSAEDKAKVNQQRDVRKHVEEQRKRGIEREDKASEISDEFATKMEANSRFLKAQKDDAGKAFTGIEYRHGYDAAAQARRDQLKGAGISFKGDKTVDGYFALYDQAKMANGQTDYDKFDRLAADYVAKHFEVLEKLSKSIGVNDDPTMAALRKARAQAKAYYDIPAYRGLTLEQGERASSVLAQASALVNAGVVPSRAAAFSKLGQEGTISSEDIALANAASQLGSNPERRQFLADHPEFAVFYKGVSEEDAGAAGTFMSGSGGGGFKYGGGGNARRRGRSGRGKSKHGRRRR